MDLLYKDSHGRVLNTEWLRWLYDTKYRYLRTLEMGKAYGCCPEPP